MVRSALTKSAGAVANAVLIKKGLADIQVSVQVASVDVGDRRLIIHSGSRFAQEKAIFIYDIISQKTIKWLTMSHHRVRS
jgi:CRISPR/Cas system-associated endoribonuclease Cas2